MPTPKDQFDLWEKISVFREKYLKDGKPKKITREMSADILTMQRECVEAGQSAEKLDTLSDELFGEQADPKPAVTQKHAISAQ